MDDLSDMFVDPNETERAVLGGGYLRDFLATGEIDKGFCVISDRRVYFRGKCYIKSGNHYRSIAEERTVDLQDVTGTGFLESKILALFIFGMLSIIWAVFCLVSMIPEFRYMDMSDYLARIFLGLCPGLILWNAYFFLRLRLFEISYAGGKIAFKASNYGEWEMQEFQKELRKSKDEYMSAAKERQTLQENSQWGQSLGSVADELKKYKELLDLDVITREEFEMQKAKLLNGR